MKSDANKNTWYEWSCIPYFVKQIIRSKSAQAVD